MNEPYSGPWCNTHRRPASLCKVRGGIMLPCVVVDLSGILEIDWDDWIGDELAANAKQLSRRLEHERMQREYGVLKGVIPSWSTP
jgi:hypothetical protein